MKEKDGMTAVVKIVCRPRYKLWVSYGRKTKFINNALDAANDRNNFFLI